MFVLRYSILKLDGYQVNSKSVVQFSGVENSNSYFDEIPSSKLNIIIEYYSSRRSPENKVELVI